MTIEHYQTLEDVINDELFFIVDNELRHGKHIDRTEFEKYEFISATFPILSEFYYSSGYRLKESSSDSYYFLLPRVDKKLTFQRSTRLLTEAEMLLGHTLAAMSLETYNLKKGFRVSLTEVYQYLETTVTLERLYKVIFPKGSSRNERTVEKNTLKELDRAIKTLSKLGFIDRIRVPKEKTSTGLRSEIEIVLKDSLMRFVEPVKDSVNPVETLKILMQEGEVLYDAVEITNNILDEKDNLSDDDKESYSTTNLATDKIYSEYPLDEEE